MKDPCGLIVVDMQRFYLEAASDYRQFYGAEACSYLQGRAETVIPATAKVLEFTRNRNVSIHYLRIAGTRQDRSDLHRFFTKGQREGEAKGYQSVYPLADDPMADIIPALAPQPQDSIHTKTGFSAFSSASGLLESLGAKGIRNLVFTGLCTSQCVETTARDASDRGFRVILVEDALADYSQDAHDASLYASSAVCGGFVLGSDLLMGKWDEILSMLESEG